MYGLWDPYSASPVVSPIGDSSPAQPPQPPAREECRDCGLQLLPGMRYPSDERGGTLLCRRCRNARTKGNPKLAQVQRDWYARNRVRILVHQREYQEANRERIAAYKREWNSQNSRDYKAERVARISTGVADKIQRRAIWGRDEGHCRIGILCDSAFVPYEEMELDHIIPLSRGGTHTWNNVQTACQPCNRHKSNRMPWEVQS